MPLPAGALDKILQELREQFNASVSIAKMRYRSWRNHPEYFEALDEAWESMLKEAADLSPQTGIRLLKGVLTTSILHQEIRDSYGHGEFGGASLTGEGQEAIGAGLGGAAETRDLIARSHRDLSTCVIRGTSIKDIWRNYLLRATGPTGGYNPNCHFADLAHGDLGFLDSDMAMSVVITNGAIRYTNISRTTKKGAPLTPEERACGIAIFGDGASSCGPAHEGMNWAKAGAWRSPILFVIANNQVALSTGADEEHGGIDLTNRAIGYEMPFISLDGKEASGDNVFAVYLAARFLLHFSRATNHPALLHALTFRRGGHNHAEEWRSYMGKLFGKEMLQAMLAPESWPDFRARDICESLGFINRAESETLKNELEKEVQTAHQEVLDEPLPDPKSKDFSFRTALIDPNWDTVRELVAAHPAAESGTHRELSTMQAFQEALREEFDFDPNLCYAGEDVAGGKGGVFAVTKPFVEDPHYKDRCLNTPISEAGLSGALVGVGLVGGKMIVEYQFGPFLWSGISPIAGIAATLPFMLRRAIGGVMVLPLGYAEGNNHYHENWMDVPLLKVHGLKVVVPGTPEDAKGLLKSAVRDPDLVAFIWPLSGFHAKGHVPEGEYFTPFTPIVRREGQDITVITWGNKMLRLALNAAKKLSEEKGPELEIIDLRVLNPLDKELILTHVARSHRVIILHEDSGFMGFGAEISASIAESLAFYKIYARIVRVAALDTPIPGSVVLEDYRLPNEERLIAEAQKLMRES